MAMKTTAAPRSCGLLIRNMQLLPRHHAPALARRIFQRRCRVFPVTVIDDLLSVHRFAALAYGRIGRPFSAVAVRPLLVQPGGWAPAHLMSSPDAGQPGAVAGIAA